MISLLHICEWIYDTPFSTSLRSSLYLFPLLEGVHALGISLVFGTVAILDLRLLGLVMRSEPVSHVTRQVLPWTWSGFVLMLATGILLSIAEAVPNYQNPAFRIKMVLLLLVGANLLFFHFTAYQTVKQWDTAGATPWRARFAAICSLSLWAGIIASGRMIAYLQ